MKTSSVSRVTLVVGSLSDNAIGRAYCLWLLCERIGVECKVVSVAPEAPLWKPLQQTDFARSCEVLSASGITRPQSIVRLMREPDLVICVKAVPSSFGVVLPFVDNARKFILDIDDPDLEILTLWGSRRRLPARVFQREFYWLLKLRQAAKSRQTIVSNPVLKRIYGGDLIPHVRVDPGQGASHVSDRPSVAFVGTPQWHKGFDVLRTAVGKLSQRGYTLTVTASPPADAHSWETWTGPVTLEEGRSLVAEADIIATPSRPTGYGRGQLPVKIMDGMLAGRAMVASRVEPLTWALRDSGVYADAGDVHSLVEALSLLQDPRVRTKFGHAARQSALSRFTPESVASTFHAAISSARGAR